MFTSGLIADYLKLLYGDKFMCVDERVYTFNGVYWTSIDNKNSILVNFIDKIFKSDNTPMLISDNLTRHNNHRN